MTKQELRKIADKHFADNPTHNLYYVTADGQCFLNWHDANEHSKTLGNRTVEEFRREDAKVKVPLIDDQVAKINAAEFPEALRPLKPNNKAAMGVWDAYEAKLDELTKKEEMLLAQITGAETPETLEALKPSKDALKQFAAYQEKRKSFLGK
jgi:hypothetical protein